MNELSIESPVAECGACGFRSRLHGKWSVEDGRLVFRAALNPLTSRGPDLESCCESDPVTSFARILVDDEPLTGERVTELRAAARSPAALREEGLAP